MILNIHTRDLHASRDAVGALLDSLASKQDLLWPRDRWPAMRFDRPLQVGAVGGHGPIRYRVERYEPGRAILFRFTGMRGIHGTHGFEIKASTPGRVRPAQSFAHDAPAEASRLVSSRARSSQYNSLHQEVPSSGRAPR
jgi:hypothetical protein